MLILYVSMKHDYGKPEQGLSFQHYNFYHTLVNLGHDILYFDAMALGKSLGRRAAGRRLHEVVRAEKPALLLAVLFKDELERRAVRRISESGDTVTVNWFCDDHWRFEEFTSHWAPCFNWAVTTSQGALAKYARIGYRNVIKSQWACNHFLYRKLDLPLAHEVTFVGKPHGNRRQEIQAMRRAGVDVQAWGQGWEAGRIGQDEMIRVFNQSRINLNLANASRPPYSAFKRARRAVRDLLVAPLELIPGVKEYRQQARERRHARRAARRQAAGGPPPSPPAGKAPPEQIKGRNFEVPGCGGFLLTGRAENLEDYYVDGREIVTFDGQADMLEKARHYLAHEDERRAIAEAGYRRTVAEHTYAHRFAEILTRIGLPAPSSDSSGSGPARGPGRTVEIA